jgi:hypothetical protein
MMTPQLEAAIVAIQPLSTFERQQLITILIQPPISLTLESLNAAFWQRMTIAQLQATQKTTPIQQIRDLAADFWPEEESIEDFLTFLKTQRQETIQTET